MSKLVLFEAIEAQILAEVPSIAAVQLWNNQPDNEDIEEARAYPRAYMEFSTMDWSDLNKGCQEGIITVTIYVVTERYQTDDRTYLTLVDQVYSALQLFEGPSFTPLKRITEVQDINHDNCIVWQIDFSTQLSDETAFTEKDYITIPGGAALDIATDLDIDNDTIRTGDGDFN